MHAVWVANEGSNVLIAEGRACSRWQLLPSLVKSRQALASMETGALGKKGGLSSALAFSLQWHAADLEMGLPIRNTNKCGLHSLLSGPQGLGSGLHLFCLAVSKYLWASHQRLWRRKTGKFQLSNPSEGLKKGSYYDKQNKAAKKASQQLGRWRQSYTQTHQKMMMTFGSAGQRDSFREEWLQIWERITIQERRGMGWVRAARALGGS